MSQRSKSGCWTCRLRRKKCSGGGPPCSSCKTRGVFCHGYGSKPVWKDRGEKEKEEATRLLMQSKRRRSRPTQAENIITQDATMSKSPNEVIDQGRNSPTETTLSVSLSPSYEQFDFDFDFLTALEPATNQLPTTDPPNSSWSSLADVELAGDLAQLQSLTQDLDTGQSTWFAPEDIYESKKDPKLLEKEMELIIHFLEQPYNFQPDFFSTSSVSQKSWFLFLLMRSPTFYYSSLSMSAYRRYFGSTIDREDRRGAYHDYQNYRARALRSLCQLSEPSDSLPGSRISVIGEKLICEVQIARLEVRQYLAIITSQT